MAEDLVFKASVEGGQSLTTLKKDYKEATDELSKLTVGTKEYQKQLEKLGAIKDDIGDLRNTINSLNPEGKVAAFQNVAGKLAGGFQAATGAAALFGAESADLEKTLLKVQAATAFAQGIQSVSGLADAFAVLKATLLTFNPILLAITAAVVAIGVAYKVWSENMSAAAKNDALLNEQLERQKRNQQGINDELQRELAIKKALGDTGSKLAKDELDAEIKRYAALRTRQILLQQVADKTEEQRKELLELDRQEADSYNQILILKLNLTKTIKEEDKKASDEFRKLREAENELYKKTIADQYAGQEAQRAADYEKKLQDEKDFQSAIKELYAKQDSEVAALNASKQAAEDAERQYEDKRIHDQLVENKAIREQDAADQIALEQQTQEAKKQAIEASLQASQALSDLYFQFQLNKAKGNAKAELEIREKQFKVDKAFNIARAIIDGIRSVQAALTLPPPASYVLAAANGILAAANIAKIASTKFDAGGASPSIPQTNVSVPSIPNPQEAQPATRLNPDGSPVQQQRGPTRAYVVESDISDKQKQVSRIEKQSQF